MSLPNTNPNMTIPTPQGIPGFNMGNIPALLHPLSQSEQAIIDGSPFPVLAVWKIAEHGNVVVNGVGVINVFFFVIVAGQSGVEVQLFRKLLMTNEDEDTPLATFESEVMYTSNWWKLRDSIFGIDSNSLGPPPPYSFAPPNMRSVIEMDPSSIRGY